MSGDTDGRLWFWDWKSTKVFRKLKCHDQVCISAIWHPVEPSKVATCSCKGGNHRSTKHVEMCSTSTSDIISASVRMVRNPRSLDTIVATNLHADILSDLAGALAGSLGVAPTANINPERRFPSMFEPIHGSAFDIAGKGIARPDAMIAAIRMAGEIAARRTASAENRLP